MNMPLDASTDQSNCPAGYYRQTGGMVIQISQKQPAPDDNRITEAEMEKLGGMSHAELINLIKRVSGAIWGIGLRTPEEIADSMKLRLATGGLTEKDMFKALPIMREWFDRQMGKAAQSIAMTVEDKGLSKLSTDRLLALEKELARMTGQDAIILPPMPGKLSDSGA